MGGFKGLQISLSFQLPYTIKLAPLVISTEFRGWAGCASACVGMARVGGGHCISNINWPFSGAIH